MKIAHQAMTWGGWWGKQKVPFNLDVLLDEVKQAGYQGVELGGGEKTLGKPAEFVKKLADHGVELAAFAANVSANPYPPSTERYQKDMDYAAAIGMKMLMVCGGFLPPNNRRNAYDNDYRIFGDNLGQACQYAAKNGQTVAFHNHCGCMVETAQEVEKLLKYLPDLKLCIDTGHLAAAGGDSTEFINKFRGRLVHVHLKDYDPVNYCFTELGRGKAGIDFPGFFQALEKNGYNGWIVVERDDPPMSGLESATISRQFLKSIGY
ncbi:MAG: sugar phosphate isomerase/epimerase [Planctomycetes bacterium]|nr:sugar phosphate isomerase/epimerase [Planctomycetota bacterium]